MTAHFVDYSSKLVETLTTQTNKLYGKFVILEHGDDAYLVFAAIEQAEFHANIVERFTLTQSVAGQYNTNRDAYQLHDPSWKIKGGGHWEYQKATHVVTLFGKSLAYGQADLNWANEQLRLLEAFDQARITVRE